MTKEEIRLKIENLKKQELHKVLHPEGTLEDHCWWCNQITILREQLKK
jgi:redox-regulated HSP33 family molecular chaperone